MLAHVSLIVAHVSLIVVLFSFLVREVLMRMVLLLALPCSLWVADGRAADKPARSDKEKIQGTWVLVSGENGGKPVSPEAAKNMSVVFAGDKLTMKNKDRTTKATFKLNPGKKPKEIDVDFDGKVGKGIYELEGDTLKVAHGELGDARPKAFPSEKGSKLTVMVFKRQKP
jgi:uncharacterized protein (TIGR03067 family)